MKKLIYLLLMVPNLIWAQRNNDTTISEKVFNITEKYDFDKNDIVKTSFHAPIEKDTATVQNSVNFELEPQSLYYPYLPLSTNPLAYKQTIQDDTFSMYGRLGFGSYKQMLIDLGVNFGEADNPWDINFLYSNAEGKKDYQNYRTFALDGLTDFQINTAGRLKIGGSYARENRNLFGFRDVELTEEDIINNWNKVDATINFSNYRIDIPKFMHIEPSADLNVTSNSFGTRELLLFMRPNIYYKVNRKFRLKFNPFLNYQTVASFFDTYNNSVAGLISQGTYTSDKMEVDGQLEINNLPGSLFGYIDLKAFLREHRNFFEFKTGRDYVQTTLRGLYQLNNYIKYLDDIQNQQRGYVEAAYQFTPFPMIDARIFMSYANYTSFTFFQHTADLSKNNYFEARYVDNMNKVQVGTEFKIKIMDEVNLYTLITYNNYSKDIRDSRRVAYIPKLEWKSKIEFPIRDRFFSYVSLLYYSNRYDYVQSLLYIPPYFDLGLGGRYKINKHFQVWGTAENLLNQKLDYYYLYPSLGINFQLGLTYLR